MKSDKIDIRVRYAETDQMGVVHHGNYALYLEVARIEWLRKLGISYKKMEETGVGLPVVSLSVKYKKPIKYDDVITVKTMLKKEPSVKLEFDHEIVDDYGQILSTANVVLVFVDLKTNKPSRPPGYFLEVLKK
ncbi:acyl-CoA thioesterase [Lacinutrix jangbogonensis]|uniref:acyl-CoA thioesterase n=1 Tax=Lacinutrix jangbogonensis TaxID=1469557 RepID=UPI00053D90C9|nr:thioesterase family protein [Lacinutrix jangbogonensis]